MSEAIVAVSNAWKSYALGLSKVEVLKGLNLSIAPKELVAVMGPSGVGKSTLLNCIAGLDVPDQGRIEVLGKNLAELDDEARTLERRRRIGIIYQFFNLVPNLDVQENVMLPFLIDNANFEPNQIDAVLERVGMAHRKDHLPSQLSGGEMQLVSIARSIVRSPKLILADEPTGNVNVATGRRIMSLLKEVLQETDCAMLLVTHNPEDAAKADRVVFITDGQIDPETALQGAQVSLAGIHERLQALGI